MGVAHKLFCFIQLTNLPLHWTWQKNRGVYVFCITFYPELLYPGAKYTKKYRTVAHVYIYFFKKLYYWLWNGNFSHLRTCFIIAFFFGPRQTTAVFSSFNKNPMDITAKVCEGSVKTGTQPASHWWTSCPERLTIFGILGPQRSMSSRPTWCWKRVNITDPFLVTGVTISDAFVWWWPW